MEFIKDFIPKGKINRPGVPNSRRTITIHDTANKKNGANAKAHAEYIKTIKERTSWHYTVDDHSIYQHIPDDEKTYHTSRADANESSISIEMCVNADGNFEKTMENTVWLVRELMKKYGITVGNIRRHKDWTGKECPGALDEMQWEKFLEKCAEDDTGKYITADELRKMGYVGVKW